jgi:VWFA-related protein
MGTRLTTALLIGAASAALIAQIPEPASTGQATFRTGANYVRVDMYATQNGQPVHDLQPGDIDVLEDGVPQKIEAFEHVQVQPAGPQAARIEPNTVAESRQMVADARARVFVIFLDTYHTEIEGSSNMRLPLVRFLDRVLGPEDLVAVMTPEMAASDITFGRKTIVISNIMQEEWTWGRRGRTGADNDPKEDLYAACYPGQRGADDIALEMKERRREQLSLDALEDLVVHLRGLREERKAVLMVSEGWRLFTENRSLARATSGQGAPGPGVFRRGRGVETVPRRGNGATNVDMNECEADRLALSLMNNSRRVRDLTDSANRGNVSFYPVYPRGLAAFDAPIGPDRPPAPAVDRANLAARQDTLRELAGNTDGLAVVNTNDIDGALRRIVADLSSYYLLGYYSTNTRLDGRFRNITVRVRRPDVEVRARRGYRGMTAEELVAPGTTERTPAGPAATAVSVVVNPRAPFRIRTSVWTADAGNAGASGGARVWVVGELDYAIRRALAWSAGATADIVVVSASGAEVTSATLDIAATEGAFALRVPADAAVTPGEYAVRVRVRPHAEPGLPVSDVARLIVTAAPSPLGEPVMLRRGPSTGPRYLMTADPRFQRNERIRFELPTTAAGLATARMVDRLGNPMQVPVQVSDRIEPAEDFRWIVVDATLAPLAAGDYAIEVSVGERTQLGMFRIVP